MHNSSPPTEKQPPANVRRLLRPDIAEIKRALALFYEPGQVIELRAVETTKATINGFYNDLDKLAKAAVECSRYSPEAVWTTLNGVHPDLLAVSANALELYAKKATADKEIVERQALLIDCDPVRLSGISATDVEHEAALELARKVRDYLRSRGWPEGALCDSGNGGHLRYRIALPNDEAAAKLVKSVLEVLKMLFATAQVGIDLTNANAGRCCKLPGTLAAKGSDIPERPHRLARILEAPERLEVIPRELLEALAAELPKPEVSSKSGTHYTGKSGSKFSLDEFLSKHSIEVKSDEQYQGARRLILEQCVFDSAHGGTSSAVFELANGALGYKCQHNGCAGKSWADVRAKFEPNYKERRERSEQASEDGRGPSQTKKLLEIARNNAELFHDSEECFGSMLVGEHLETYRVRSRGFRRWLSHQFFIAEHAGPNSDAMQAALNTIEALAQFQGPERSTYLRVCRLDEKIYLDLCNDTWQQVEIDKDGWRVIESKDSPIRFRRAHGMQALHTPASGGSIKDLRKFVNVASENDFYLIVAWLLSCLCGAGPYPVLVVHGEQGSAKSTLARLLRLLTDPSMAPLRSEPREARDLAVAANNGWVIAFDNVSYLPSWLSDALCRLSTGGGFSTRELYTDGDEIIFDAMRPGLLTAIEEVATRGDLLDRALSLCLPAIPESKRKTEADFLAKFDAACPRIMGALLDATSCALRKLKETTLDKLPRMADFAKWVTAAEEKLGWPTGSFMAAYTENRKSAVEQELGASPVVAELLKLVLPVEKTATELLAELEKYADEKTKKSRSWPKRPDKLSNALKRLAPALRATGIEVEFSTSHHPRTVHIWRRESPETAAPKEGESGVPSVPSVPTQQNQALLGDATGDATSKRDATSVPGDATGTLLENPKNSMNSRVGDARDARDASFPTLLADEEAELDAFAMRDGWEPNNEEEF